MHALEEYLLKKINACHILYFVRKLLYFMKVTQSCPNLCESMDCNPPGSSVHRFFRKEYWNGLPCPPPGDLPDLGNTGSPALQADSLQSESLKVVYKTTYN